MSHGPKRKPRVMTYYVMINKHTLEYFINKSTNPRVSVRHHFHRAHNPNRTDYESDFSKALRLYGPEGFDVTYTLTAPEWMVRRAHYMPAIEGMTLDAMKAAIEEYELPPEAATPKKAIPAGTYVEEENE